MRSGIARGNLKRRAFYRWVALVLVLFGGLCADLWISALQTEHSAPELVLAQSADMLQYEAPRDGAVEKISVADDNVASDSWPMVAANPQRTSWSPEEVRGKLSPIWYRVIEPYIPPKMQIVAAGGRLFISTARGLYALDAETGETAWVYPTELPLGNSPTVFGNVVYVSGLDHKLHAVNVQTGVGIWTYEAGAGFETNPLVLDINGHVYIYVGNRDGNMYAIEDLGTTASLAWVYPTDGPILFSAAYKEDNIYFASNDSYAYALDVSSGDLVWKSDKLQGAGFHTWWPVLYEDASTGADVVILAGSNNYRFYLAPAYGFDLQNRERNDIFPDRASEPKGTPFGTLYSDGTIDATRVLNYFEEKPWRRTYFVLDRVTGEEVTFDFDGDGKPEYAPVLWHGTHSGNRYPPVIGSDGIIYQSNTYMSGGAEYSISGGQITGWEYGSSSISSVTPVWIAMDEPLAYAAGGDLIYWNHCNDRSAGAFDITIPNTRFWPELTDSAREWRYYGSVGLVPMLPGYNILYEGVSPDNYGINSLFRGSINSRNGIYGQHGHQNAPIPYAGKVYMHRSNAVIAFGNSSEPPVQLSMAETIAVPETEVVVIFEQLRQKLMDQVRDILDAGHLRPGYRSVGLFDHHTRDQYGDHMIDYWHQPSDILYALTLAFPYLPSDMQQEVRVYLHNEYVTYPPHQYTHVGWKDGAAREPFYLPQEAEIDLVNHPARVSGYGFDGWTWPPYKFYALWKYAELAGSGQEIFDANQSRLEQPPSDAFLIEYPYVHNAYIAGYLGYLELEALAGYPESADVRAELSRLLALRVSTFSKDTPYTDGRSARVLSVARNFMFLVPELGQYLRDNALAQVQAAVTEYDAIAPYWFITDFDVTHGEGASQHFYDYHALFQAKALILQESGDELVKYLDVPAVQVGDLFYIQNLVAVLDSGISLGFDKSVIPSAGWHGDALSYTLSFLGKGVTLSLTDTLPAEVSEPYGFSFEGINVAPVYDAGAHQLVWSSGTVSTGQLVTLRYQVDIAATESQLLVNTATLNQGPLGGLVTAAAIVFANPYQCYLPLVMKTY